MHGFCYFLWILFRLSGGGAGSPVDVNSVLSEHLIFLQEFIIYANERGSEDRGILSENVDQSAKRGYGSE